MDDRRFDALTRSLGSAATRRGTLGALLAAVFAPLLAEDDADSVLAKGKRKGKQRGHRRNDGNGRDRNKSKNKQKPNQKQKHKSKQNAKQPENSAPQQAPVAAEAACFGGGTCTPGPAANLAKCDFGGSSALKGKNLQRSNFDSANLRGADASGADFRSANLGKACLVDANFTGAIMNGSTNTGAIFCRTTMPNGTVNNAGCNLGTTCCPTCDAAHPCPGGQVCCNGRCRAGDCCSDAQCTDPTKPICLNNRCSPCTTNRQCGNGRVCCEGQCQSGVCCTAADCADRACQGKTCSNNQCAYSPLDGAPCDDGDPCTTNDTCRSGSCAGTAKDCSTQADPCNDGVCRQGDGQCIKRPKADGTGCSDNDNCTTGDSCRNGVCIAGAGVNCASLNDECNTGVCRQADGQCIKRPQADGTPCGVQGACQNGVCQEPSCGTPGEVCNPNDNQCCQETPTTCAVLNPNCYATGTPENARCCRETGRTCGDDCQCCAGQLCEGGECCQLSGGRCADADDCCTYGGLTQQVCGANGTCCARDGAYCEDGLDCCAGLCVDNECRGCIGLRGECDASNNQCCQNDGRTNCATSFDFGSTNCCKPLGGTCSGDRDCCDGARATCTSGRCCLGEDATCTANAECCSGFECRGGVCRSNICRQPGEACPAGASCCPGSGATCTGGTCCQGLGSTCDKLAGASDPCCGARNAECCGFSEQYCASGQLEKCCYQDFQNFISGPDCTADEQCCSGHCTTQFARCCRPRGAPCDEIGALNFDCCTHEALTCDGTTCVPCRTLGQTCIKNAEGDSTCCIGSFCNDAGICAQSTCGISGAPCQDASTCCPGSICSAGAVCLKVCQAEGEFCRCFNGACAPLPCCGGLTCDGNQEKCVRA